MIKIPKIKIRKFIKFNIIKIPKIFYLKNSIIYIKKYMQNIPVGWAHFSAILDPSVFLNDSKFYKER